MKKVTRITCVAAALVLSITMLLTGCVVTPITPQTPDTQTNNNPATNPAPAREAAELIWYLVGPQQDRKSVV